MGEDGRDGWEAMHRTVTLGLILWLLALPAGAAEVELYRARHRTAPELAALAADLLGEAGTATADPRTRTLVLQGSREALQRTLAVLERLDVPLPSFRIESRTTRAGELVRLGLALDGWLEIGDLRIGRWPAGPAAAPAGLELSARATRSSQRRRFEGVVTVLEGRVAEVWTGVLLPAETWLETPRGGLSLQPLLVPVLSGLRVRPASQADGSIELELQAVVRDRGAAGAIREAGARTRVRVNPGEWVASAGSRRGAERRDLDGPGAWTHAEAAEALAILIRARPAASAGE